MTPKSGRDRILIDVLVGWFEISAKAPAPKSLTLVPGVPGEECVEFLDLFSYARQGAGGGIVGLTATHFAGNYLAAL